MSSGPLAAIDVFSNKVLMYKKCLDLGVKVKNFCLLTEYKPGELRFPLILKRNVEKGLMEYKCCKIDDESHLFEISKEIPVESQKYLLLQECIGEEFSDIDFRGYIHRGKVIGYAVMHEVRCHPAGVSSYIEEITDKGIVDSIYDDVAKLLNGSSFTGFLDIDIKCNLSTGEAYILDFNPRSPASLSAWVFKYRRKDLIELFMNIDNPKSLVPVNTAIKWCNLARDYRARKKNHEKLKLRDILKLKLDLWDCCDPLPFLLHPLWILNRKLFKEKVFE